MKKGLRIVLCVLLLMAAVGCAPAETVVGGQTSRVALIAKSAESDFWKAVFAGARSAAVEYGITVDIFAPETEDDYQAQIDFIEAAVRDGYDAIVFSACSYDQTVPAIEAALDAGVRVVTIDSAVGTRRNVTFIGTDSVSAGRMAGEALSTLIDGEIRVGIISYEEFSGNGQQRNQGFSQYVDETPGMTLVDLRYCLSNREDPKRQTLDMLRLYPEINAIATFNEWTTLGVGDAILEAGLGDAVTVVAFDNNEDSIEMLELGVIDALIVQNPFAMGYLGVEHAIAQIAGRKSAEGALYTESVVVTAENMYTAQNQKLLFPFVK